MKEDAANSRPGLVSDFTPKELKNFVQVNLVGDNNIYNPQNIDAGLVNGWDITFGPTGPAWVSSEGKGTSPIYNFDGVPVSTAVRIPDGEVSAGDQGHPTGPYTTRLPILSFLMGARPNLFLLQQMEQFRDGMAVSLQ